MDAVEAVARALATQMEAQADDTTPSSVQREKGLVWLEGWFDLKAALSAARPFIAAECAKVADECPIYPVGRRWSSTTAAREDIATAIKETIR